MSDFKSKMTKITPHSLRKIKEDGFFSIIKRYSLIIYIDTRFKGVLII